MTTKSFSMPVCSPARPPATKSWFSTFPGAAEQTDSGVSIIPAIAEFNLTGDLNPPTGSIAGNVLSYETAINQSGHASAARIVGFAGTDREPSAVTVLANITDLHRESGTITIPAGVSLAAEGDVYTVRLEVYTPGETPATDQPRVYKDERITARAVAATVHFGRLLSTQGAADVDFANDISTAGAVAGNVGPSREYPTTPTSTESIGRCHRALTSPPPGAHRASR